MSDGSNIREEVAAIIYVSEVFVCWVFFIIIASKTHTEKKQKLHKINKVIKRKKTKKKTNSEFTHLHGNILTNIKICYSSANSIYYCTQYVSEVFVGGETTYCNLQQKDLPCVMLYIVAQWSKKSPLFSGILFTLMWSRKPGWKSTVIVAPLFFLPPFLDTGLP